MSSNETAATGNGPTGADGGGGPGGAGGAGGGGATGTSPDEMMVYWLDIGLLCVLGLFFLAFLPRAIGRFCNFTEWTRGLLLRGGSAAGLMTRRVTPTDVLYRADSRSSFGEGSSDHSHTSQTLADHKDAYVRSVKEWTSMPAGGRGDVVHPTHVRSVATVLHPISKFFTHPLGAGETTGKLFMTIAYFSTIAFIALRGAPGPFPEPNRLGFIAISQLPVVIALGTKNNAVGMLLGMGYEKLMFLHRLVGGVVFLTANIHAVNYLISFVSTGNFAALDAPFIKYGQIGLVGVTVLYLAAGPIRNLSYTLFLIAHIGGAVAFFVGIWFHQSVTQKYILLSGGIYACDHLLRVIKTRFATAKITAVPELNLTRIEIPSIGAGWRAGQHVRLRVLSGAVGWFGWTTAHPFTIASASESPYGMVLMVKKSGRWTRNLYTAASQSGTDAAESGYTKQQVRNVRMIVEGPYGGMGHMIMSSYSSVLLVAGGSGITFALGATEELIQDVLSGRSSVKFIELVWTTQERGSLTPMIPTFSNLLGLVANIPGIILRITVHWTRAEKPDTDGGKARSTLDAHLATLGPNLTLQPGRPSLERITKSIARLTIGVPNPRGVAVGVCGPGSLAVETAKAVKGVDSDLRRMCGGVELHEEVFSW